jgi:hypothetical protein
VTGIGHNGGPDMAQPRNFKKRWAYALFAHPKKPIGTVAMGFKLYMEMNAQGEGAVISDREFSEACGVSERACQNFKRWLLDEGFVSIQLKGNKGRSNTFAAKIPGQELTARNAANAEEQAAPIAGKENDQRHPLPETANTMPAIHAEEPPSPAPRAVNAPPRAPTPAHFEPPSGVISPLDLNNTGEVDNNYTASARVKDTPHMNGKGFIISAKDDLFVPTKVVETWKEKFPEIDLEADLASLGTHLLSKGPMHPGWTSPEGWMVACLSKNNREARSKRLESEARIKRAEGQSKKVIKATRWGGA